MSERNAPSIRDLETRDVLGAGYPADVFTAVERRRWNQCRLIALALARSNEPGMPNAEFLYLTAVSIYRIPEFETGTDDQLAEEIADARAAGWL